MPSRAVRRIGWVTADQGLSSLTNVALTVAVAASTSAREFGAFALAYALYTFAVQLAQAGAAEPLLVRYSGVDEGPRRAATATVISAVVAAGVVVGAAMAAGGWAIGGDLGPALGVLGVALPLLLVQDLMRFAFMAGGRPDKAFANDLLWGVTQLGTITLAAALGLRSVPVFVGCWAASGAMAGLLALRQGRVVPAATGPRTWWLEHRDLAGPYLTETLALSGSVQLTLYVVGAVAGLPAVGAMRAVQTLFGPVAVVANVVRVGAIPELSRMRAEAVELLPRAAIRAAVVASAAALAWGAALLVVPDALGVRAFGDTWSGAQQLIVVFCVQRAAAGFAVGPLAGLRVLQVVTATARLRLAYAAASITAGTVGALVRGALGATVGLAVVTVAFAVALSVLLLTSIGRSCARGLRPEGVAP